ncbi:tyrosine-type recombinase/integrase [Sporosarcina sp. NPDC096371]|uniref:tyrosine-type recombinase/integrase n=1 Tax=Sporosarcina sp. NPDC096371 TaxID=3364530 RepID=UPI003826FA6D
MELRKNVNNSSVHFYDKPFRKVIEEFLKENHLSEQNEIEPLVEFFYKEFLKEKDLFPKNKNINLKKLQINHVLKIQDQVEFLTTNNHLEKSNAASILIFLDALCRYLTKKEITKIYYRTPQTVKKPQRKIRNNYPILSNFKDYMKNKNYSNTTIQYYITSVKYFLKYSAYNSDIQNSNQFWLAKINQFEDHLNKKVLLEKIALNTAYAYLKALRLFTNYLHTKKEISFIYNIPNKMFQTGKRSNEYVNIHDVLLVMDKVFETSNDVLRDISIILILLNTGCRPIEVVNLNIDDIYFHEKLIILKSKKSFQRTLSLTKETLSFIEKYLKIRKNYHPLDNTEALFLSPTGTKMDSVFITRLFRKYNHQTFKEIRFTPKTLRHTFITDALNDDENTIEQLREIVGHKHLISTKYYFFRDINKMKEVFLKIKLF